MGLFPPLCFLEEKVEGGEEEKREESEEGRILQYFYLCLTCLFSRILRVLSTLMVISYNMIAVIYLFSIYYSLLVFLAESFITLIYKSFFEYFFGYLISNVGMHH